MRDAFALVLDVGGGVLGDSDWFVANRFSAADIQLSFVVEAGAMRGPVADYPNLVRFKKRFQARPAYQRALERGGKYDLLD